MLFNFKKYKCLHTRHENLDVNYKMGDTVPGTTVKEKNLGVTISADTKVSHISQEGGLHIDEICWTLDKASLSTCHLGICLG